MGLGGSILTIPFLTIVLGIDIRLAMGAGLISTIATSTGPALTKGIGRFMNLRVALFLELLATAGAIAGATMVGYANLTVLSLMFGVTMIAIAALSIRRTTAHAPKQVALSPLAIRLGLNGTAPNERGEPVPYQLHRVSGGAMIMFGAGILSGLLGIANGALKMLAMDNCMGMPPRVSSASSNFMIGLTATGGAIVYLQDGFIDPRLALLVIAGALPGALIGARLLPIVPVRMMQWIFVAMLVGVGVEMVARGLGGRL